MRKMLVATTTGLTAAALSFAIAGCGPSGESKSTTSESTAVTAVQDQPPKLEDGLDDTLHDYIVEHNIAEVPFKPGDPGTPTYDLALPEHWALATEIPEWAFGAIVYDQPRDASDPPTITAIANKLTGDVEGPEVLDYASGLLDNMPDFKPLGEATERTISGFNSVDYAGTYLHEGKTRFVAQKTVVVPGPDALFVVQLNGTAVESDSQIVLDAMQWINDRTTITAA
ncbi:LpqN/LpqT family lipoprotein [Mycolicibacterium alvei]|jgi:hypothetical protein|nr:LpqN/LpqT family lipoprotein [Mycolicibacterium alvei]